MTQHLTGTRLALKRLWSISFAVFPGRELKAFFGRLSFMAYSLPHLNHIGRWINGVDNVLLLEEVRRSPVTYAAIYRPYVNKRWGIRHRLKAIEQHYLALRDRAALFNIDATQYFDLLQLDSQYLDLRIVVDRPKWMRAEGEVAISLFYQNDRIYTAKFLIIGGPHQCSLVIGAFQGWSGADAKEIYVNITRALHGARPRDFLVNILKIVAANIGCVDIWGVSDACHRSEHWLVRAEKHASYDEVWIENGGQLNSQGFFVMPTDLRQRDLADIPSRKRAQYRRRYELLDELRDRIAENMAVGSWTVLVHGSELRAEAGALHPLKAF